MSVIRYKYDNYGEKSDFKVACKYLYCLVVLDLGHNY